jgi:hypothetical protein
MEFCAGINKNENCLQENKLQNVMLSKINQVQKLKGHMFSFICESWTYKLKVYIGIYIYI